MLCHVVLFIEEGREVDIIAADLTSWTSTTLRSANL